MDRLDGYISSNKIESSTSAQPVIDQTNQVRPLKYDAYSENTSPPLSSSLSLSTKSYAALPKPSIAQDSRARRQRKQQEEHLQSEIQKSIARLTLESEFSDEAKEDINFKGKATSRDDGVLF